VRNNENQKTENYVDIHCKTIRRATTWEKEKTSR